MGVIKKAGLVKANESVINDPSPDLKSALIEFQLGPTAPVIAKQLKNLGIEFDERSGFIEGFQRDADSILYLMARGLMTFDARDYARNKLNEKINEYLKNS